MGRNYRRCRDWPVAIADQSSNTERDCVAAVSAGMRLMTEFYRQWQSGLGKAQALRQAMLITMETHPEPRDWAAFTLIGGAD